MSREPLWRCHKWNSMRAAPSAAIRSGYGSPHVKTLVLCALAIVALPRASQAEIPLRDFFKNPEKTGFALSPDGKMLAFRQPWEHRMNVFVQSVAGGPAKRITDEKQRDVATAFWKGNDHIVYLRDFQGDGNFHLMVVKKDGTDLRDLTPGAKVRAELIEVRPQVLGSFVQAVARRCRTTSRTGSST